MTRVSIGAPPHTEACFCFKGKCEKLIVTNDKNPPCLGVGPRSLQLLAQRSATKLPASQVIVTLSMEHAGASRNPPNDAPWEMLNQKITDGQFLQTPDAVKDTKVNVTCGLLSTGCIERQCHAVGFHSQLGGERSNTELYPAIFLHCPSMWLNIGLPPWCPQVVRCYWGEIPLVQDGLMECDQPGGNSLKHYAMDRNWTRVTERTDSEIHSFSPWAIPGLI